MSFFKIDKQTLSHWRKTNRIQFKKKNCRTFSYKFPTAKVEVEETEYAKFPVYVLTPEFDKEKIEENTIWYTPQEIHEMFGTSKQTLYNWRKIGKIKSKKRKGSFLYQFPSQG